MHYTFHLTAACNMRCKYCYVSQTAQTMTAATVRAAVDMALDSKERSVGLIFFGGEPLLCRDLIEETVSYANKKSAAMGRSKTFFKITTNGLLLDESFLQYAIEHDIFIALSIDGTEEAHNMHRVSGNGTGTHDRAIQAAKLVLPARPYAPALMTVNPDTVRYYYDSVCFLYNLGFRYIICSMNYSADWDEQALKELKRQYRKLAGFYYEHMISEDKFYLSPFDVKISSHIHNMTYHHERCELGRRQLSIAPDGGLYPCVQFVGDDRYKIGDVWSGPNRAMLHELFLRNESEKSGCDICALKKRCNHYCACLNKQATGSIDTVSEVLCAHERIILPIADSVAARLYSKRSAMFIQKQYNDLYPLISLAEDKSKKRSGSR